MLATVAAADSAKVKKKSTAFLYIAKWNHTLCALYINRRVNCVIYSILYIYIYIYLYIYIFIYLYMYVKELVNIFDGEATIIKDTRNRIFLNPAMLVCIGKLLISYLR